MKMRTHYSLSLDEARRIGKDKVRNDDLTKRVEKLEAKVKEMAASVKVLEENPELLHEIIKKYRDEPKA
jgi:predicted nuclease with TOPRIM domain